MLTYINDRKLSDYPFYGLSKPRPFPPGCITHIGICAKEQPNGAFFASAISISMDGVLVSLCEETTTGDKELGSVYVVAGEESTGLELEKDDVKYSISMMIDRSLLKNAYGNYTGRFYLDPHCVTYISENVAGRLHQVVINGQTQTLDDHLDFSCAGDLITLTEPVGTQNSYFYTTYLKAGSEVNDIDLVYKTVSTAVPVRSINTASPSGEKPQFTLEAASESITFNVQEKANSLVVEIHGDTAFPNCYVGKGDEA